MEFQACINLTIIQEVLLVSLPRMDVAEMYEMKPDFLKDFYL